MRCQRDKPDRLTRSLIAYLEDAATAVQIFAARHGRILTRSEAMEMAKPGVVDWINRTFVGKGQELP